MASQSVRISKNQIRTKQINVSVSDDEKAKISAFCQLGKMSVSAYCRHKALNFPVSNRFDRAIISDLMRIHMKHVAELKAIGNNVNQLAHVANANGHIPAELKDLHARLTDLLKSSAELQRQITNAIENKS